MACENAYAEIRAESGVFKFYSNGQWLESSSGKSVPVINPSTQEKDYAVQGQRPAAVGDCNRCRHSGPASCSRHLCNPRLDGQLEQVCMHAVPAKSPHCPNTHRVLLLLLLL